MIDFSQVSQAKAKKEAALGDPMVSKSVNEAHTPLKAKSPTFPSRAIPTTYLRFRKLNACGDSFEDCFQALSTIMAAQSCSVLQTNSVATINRFLLNGGRRKVGALMNVLPCQCISLSLTALALLQVMLDQIAGSVPCKSLPRGLVADIAAHLQPGRFVCSFFFLPSSATSVSALESEFV